MKNKLNYLIVILTIVTVMLYLFYLEDSKKDIIKKIDILQASALQKDNYDDLQFTAELLKRFADNHVYINDSYNCVNYSRDLKFISDNLGIKMELKGGKPLNNNVGHLWTELCMDIEPQTGIPINYDNQFNEPYSDKVMERFQ